MISPRIAVDTFLKQWGQPCNATYRHLAATSTGTVSTSVVTSVGCACLQRISDNPPSKSLVHSKVRQHRIGTVDQITAVGLASVFQELLKVNVSGHFLTCLQEAIRPSVSPDAIQDAPCADAPQQPGAPTGVVVVVAAWGGREVGCSCREDAVMLLQHPLEHWVL